MTGIVMFSLGEVREVIKKKVSRGRIPLPRGPLSSNHVSKDGLTRAIPWGRAAAAHMEHLGAQSGTGPASLV
jgi:hypothetical protein